MAIRTIWATGSMGRGSEVVVAGVTSRDNNTRVVVSETRRKLSKRQFWGVDNDWTGGGRRDNIVVGGEKLVGVDGTSPVYLSSDSSSRKELSIS